LGLGSDPQCLFAVFRIAAFWTKGCAVARSGAASRLAPKRRARPRVDLLADTRRVPSIPSVIGSEEPGDAVANRVRARFQTKEPLGAALDECLSLRGKLLFGNRAPVRLATGCAMLLGWTPVRAA
jgi:hypothetical protein